MQFPNKYTHKSPWPLHVPALAVVVSKPGGEPALMTGYTGCPAVANREEDEHSQGPPGVDGQRRQPVAIAVHVATVTRSGAAWPTTPTPLACATLARLKTSQGGVSLAVPSPARCWAKFSNDMTLSLIVAVPGGAPSLVTAATLDELQAEIDAKLGIAKPQQALMINGVKVPRAAPYVVDSDS